MLYFTKHQLYRRGWDRVTYADLLQQPLAKLVTCFLGIAAEVHARRITFGLPPGRELSKEDEAEILARHESFMQIVNAVGSGIRQDDRDQPELAVWSDGVRFHRRDGLPEVPCWQEIDGQWYRVPGILACLYPYIPQHLCDRLVSLDKKPSEGGRAEWIEHTPVTANPTEDRKFTRVNLVLETNNSATVELLESRVIGPGVVAWWRHWKV